MGASVGGAVGLLLCKLLFLVYASISLYYSNTVYNIVVQWEALLIMRRLRAGERVYLAAPVPLRIK